MAEFSEYIPNGFVLLLLTALRLSADVLCLPWKCVYLFRHRTHVITSFRKEDLALAFLYCQTIRRNMDSNLAQRALYLWWNQRSMRLYHIYNQLFRTAAFCSCCTLA